MSKRYKAALRRELDKINNSKHEFHLYKELLDSAYIDDVVYSGPTLQADQQVILHDFRDWVKEDDIQLDGLEEIKDEGYICTTARYVQISG